MSDPEYLTVEALIAQYQSPTGDAALEGLELVPWAELEHAHGSANDVPALLRAALSANEDHHNFALQLLFETVWHQGTVYEASAYVVPFLYRMLQAPQTPDKFGIAQLICQLACGSGAFVNVMNRPTKELDFWRQIFEKKGSSLQAEIASGVRSMETIRMAVSAQLELLYPYLEDEAALIHWDIAKAFAHFPERAQETIPLLERASLVETSQSAQEQILITLVALKGEPSPLPKIRDASNEPVERVSCPQCGSPMYESQGGQNICPSCGYGAATGNT